MNLSTSPPSLHYIISSSNKNSNDKFQLQRPPSRRRSNSSSKILASTVNVKAVRSPTRSDANFDNTPNNHSDEHDKLLTSNRSIPRPPRLAFDTSVDPRIPMTPPSRQEYKTHQYQNYQNMLSSYNLRDYYDLPPPKGLSGKESRTTSFSSTNSNKSTPSINKVLSAFYNERIEKRTAFDDDDDDDDDDECYDSESDATLSVSSGEDGRDCRKGRHRNNHLAKQVSLLRKEIDAVKSSLVGLQKDHKAMLNEKKQLEEQYQETKDEVAKTLESSTNELMDYNELLNSRMEKLSLELGGISSHDNSAVSPSSEDGEWPMEYANIMNNCVQQAKELEYLQAELEKSKRDFNLLLNFKEEIEKTLEEKEREYLEQIRHCEAVVTGQAGMIDSMENLLKELEEKMDKLLLEKNEKRQERFGKHKHSSSISSQLSTISVVNSISSGHEKRKKASVIKNDSIINGTSNDSPNPTSTEELVPAYCLSPPQPRRQSYTNPLSLFTDEGRIQHQTRFGLAKRWVEDDEVSVCQQAHCNVKFNLWNRRHHCRRCGNIFCNKHSAYSMLLFPDGSEDWGGVWSRVCEGCFKDTK